MLFGLWMGIHPGRLLLAASDLLCSGLFLLLSQFVGFFTLAQLCIYWVQSVTWKESSDTSGLIAFTANIIFVAYDSKMGKVAPVNRFTLETEQEKLLYEEAEARNKIWKRGDDRKEFENGEVIRLEALLALGGILCDMPALADRDCILPRDICLQNSLIFQPQQRNIHGWIYGGFFMHRAFELAFIMAYAFAGMM